MKLSHARTLALILLVASCAALSGCGMVNRIRAKNALNEGVRAYKDGRFADAQAKFQEALELDPSQANAPVFIARSVHQQYKPGVDTPENKAKAEEAIEAYKRVMESTAVDDKARDDAYNAVAYLYRQMREPEKEEAWLMQRANLESAPKPKRSDALTILASKQWNCAYEITEQKENKETVDRGGRVIVQYKKPGNQADFDKAQGCVRRGLELAEQAISLNAENPNAWSYKTNLLREASKLAQMDGKAEDKTRFDDEANKAEEEQKRLLALAAEKKAAEEAAKSPTPPAS
ncbi:MAG TPA: hypothetical protein VFX96_07855 [Pyrinomonadaceae bacterium]|nr:hypothetical protein [Pyrinomonadaceae bacterium]